MVLLVGLEACFIDISTQVDGQHGDPQNGPIHLDLQNNPYYPLASLQTSRHLEKWASPLNLTPMLERA